MFAMFAMFVQTQLTSHPSSCIHHHGSHDDNDGQRRPTRANEGQRHQLPTRAAAAAGTRDVTRLESLVCFLFFYIFYLLNRLFILQVV
jgi:hypothetical protein